MLTICYELSFRPRGLSKLGVGVVYGLCSPLLEGKNGLVHADRISAILSLVQPFLQSTLSLDLSQAGIFISEHLLFQWPPCWRHRLSDSLSSSIKWAQGGLGSPDLSHDFSITPFLWLIVWLSSVEMHLPSFSLLSEELDLTEQA